MKTEQAKKKWKKEKIPEDVKPSCRQNVRISINNTKKEMNIFEHMKIDQDMVQTAQSFRKD